MAPTPLRKRVLRHADLLALDLEFVNLALNEDGTRLSRVEPDQPAYLVVILPPQHIAEQSFRDPSDGSPMDAPVKAVLAGPSRLVFEMPADPAGLGYTLADLLAWEKLAAHVPANALPPGATDLPPGPPPEGPLTALELPYRLFLSPDAGETWLTTGEPVTHDGRTELWHARLARRTPEGSVESGLSVRAVARRARTDPFTIMLPQIGAVDQLDQIVRLSSDFSIKAQRPPGWGTLLWARWRNKQGIPQHYVPRAIDAERLILTPLGASARLSSAWDYPTVKVEVLQTASMPVFGLEQWQHITSLGRDQYVRVVSKGYGC